MKQKEKLPTEVVEGKHEPHPAIAELEKNHRKGGHFILMGNGSIIKVEPTIEEKGK